MKARFPKPEAERVYVARESFTFRRDGEPVTVRRGTRLSGDQLPVQAFPSLFAPDPQTPPQDVGVTPRRREPPSVDARSRVPVELVRLKRTLRVGVGDDGTGKLETIAELPAGTLLSADAELVRLYPDEFEALE